ncbi:hypothetical protein GGR57DRAFT_501002 [Xylariaceae sp. FL1272]|nr:hypothetical protein GGR57DRAFT_501002 [Xylariaceae sp. FL1272]
MCVRVVTTFACGCEQTSIRRCTRRYRPHIVVYDPQTRPHGCVFHPTLPASSSSSDSSQSDIVSDLSGLTLYPASDPTSRTESNHESSDDTFHTASEGRQGSNPASRAESDHENSDETFHTASEGRQYDKNETVFQARGGPMILEGPVVPVVPNSDTASTRGYPVPASPNAPAPGESVARGDPFVPIPRGSTARGPIAQGPIAEGPTAPVARQPMAQGPIVRRGPLVPIPPRTLRSPPIAPLGLRSPVYTSTVSTALGGPPTFDPALGGPFTNTVYTPRALGGPSITPRALGGPFAPITRGSAAPIRGPNAPIARGPSIVRVPPAPIPRGPITPSAQGPAARTARGPVARGPVASIASNDHTTATSGNPTTATSRPLPQRPHSKSVSNVRGTQNAEAMPKKRAGTFPIDGKSKAPLPSFKRVLDEPQDTAPPPKRIRTERERSQSLRTPRPTQNGTVVPRIRAHTFPVDGKPKEPLPSFKRVIDESSTSDGKAAVQDSLRDEYAFLDDFTFS